MQFRSLLEGLILLIIVRVHRMHIKIMLKLILNLTFKFTLKFILN